MKLVVNFNESDCRFDKLMTMKSFSLGFDEFDKPYEAGWEANGRVAKADWETDEVNGGDNVNKGCRSLKKYKDKISIVFFIVNWLTKKLKFSLLTRNNVNKKKIFVNQNNVHKSYKL